jgi:hypothetical protein
MQDKLTFIFTEQASIAVSLETCIWDVLGSNLGWTSAALTEAFRDIPQSLQANSGIVPRLGRELLLPNPLIFAFHESSYHSML